MSIAFLITAVPCFRRCLKFASLLLLCGLVALLSVANASENRSLSTSEPVATSATWEDGLTPAVTPINFTDEVVEEEGAEAASSDCSNCNSCCQSGCECCNPPLLKCLDDCFAETPCGFDSFISPMTNPTFFEDPRTLSEARLIFLNHKVPGALGGGDIQLYAMHVRAALSDRLSLIATKDGYIVSSNPNVGDGWADVSVGLKYNLMANYCEQRLLSVGATYEMAVGSQRALQGNGDGTFHLFLSGGAELFQNSHWISGSGLVLPTDGDAESDLFYWSNHFDYYLGRCWYALTEFNWYHWMESGANGIPGVEGGDLFNLGSTGVAGNDIVTGAFGLKYKPNRCTEVGLAWEVPLTDRQDVLENRLTADWIIRF